MLSPKLEEGTCLSFQYLLARTVSPPVADEGEADAEEGAEDEADMDGDDNNDGEDQDENSDDNE
jgi:hypothetical protein